jgi:GDP/UDP-N,N'-diacetylbacillosamine 2-epimerase (hydrolysing)
MRQVCYVSGTRADFGLMSATLRRIQADPRLSLGVLVTGMHLSPLYGETVREIREAGFPILAEVPVPDGEPSGVSMASGIATMLEGFTRALDATRPDIVLALGDRGEMLAAAIAAIHLGIPVAHVHGGERSGSVDEPVRHAISKLSHLHFTSTAAARERLLRMGELADRVWVTGAPGLDGIRDLKVADKATLRGEAGFTSDRPLALALFHPVVNDPVSPAAQVRALLQGARAAGCQVLVLQPNSDAGAAEIREVLNESARNEGLAVRTHLARDRFLSWMAQCDVMIGNSSSGIIEAASFGTPVVNVGNRQNLREAGANVVTVPADEASITAAIGAALRNPKPKPINIYGDGHAGDRIVELLATVELGPTLLAKCNAY